MTIKNWEDTDKPREKMMAQGKNMMTIQVATMAYAYLVPSRRCSTEAPLFLARNSVGLSLIHI